VHGWSPDYNEQIDMIVYDKHVPKQLVQYHIDLLEVSMICDYAKLINVHQLVLKVSQ
jgi:hypothetical protein